MVNCEDCNHHDHPAEGLPEDKAEMHRGKQDSENSKETVTKLLPLPLHHNSDDRGNPAQADPELIIPSHASVIKQ